MDEKTVWFPVYRGFCVAERSICVRVCLDRFVYLLAVVRKTLSSNCSLCGFE